jgi:hypothetical protein
MQMQIVSIEKYGLRITKLRKPKINAANGKVIMSPIFKRTLL